MKKKKKKKKKKRKKKRETEDKSQKKKKQPAGEREIFFACFLHGQLSKLITFPLKPPLASSSSTFSQLPNATRIPEGRRRRRVLHGCVHMCVEMASLGIKHTRGERTASLRERKKKEQTHKLRERERERERTHSEKGRVGLGSLLLLLLLLFVYLFTNKR
jgi:hypothetical protein